METSRDPSENPLLLIVLPETVTCPHCECEINTPILSMVYTNPE